MAPSETNGTIQDANGHSTLLHKDPDPKAPFLGKQPYGMPADLVIPKIMDIDNVDEKLWVT